MVFNGSKDLLTKKLHCPCTVLKSSAYCLTLIGQVVSGKVYVLTSCVKTKNIYGILKIVTYTMVCLEISFITFRQLFQLINLITTACYISFCKGGSTEHILNCTFMAGMGYLFTVTGRMNC